MGVTIIDFLDDLKKKVFLVETFSIKNDSK